MTRPFTALALVAFTLFAAQSFADDSLSPSDKQRIKTCVEKQKMTSNVTMSEEAMTRFCKDELKRQKATGEMPETQPHDVPHDTPPQ